MPRPRGAVVASGCGGVGVLDEEGAARFVGGVLLRAVQGEAAEGDRFTRLHDGRDAFAFNLDVEVPRIGMADMRQQAALVALRHDPHCAIRRVDIIERAPYRDIRPRLQLPVSVVLMPGKLGPAYRGRGFFAPSGNLVTNWLNHMHRFGPTKSCFASTM